MTYFDRAINNFAEACKVSELLEKEEIENYIFLTINHLSSYGNLMHALQFLSALSDFLNNQICRCGFKSQPYHFRIMNLRLIPLTSGYSLLNITMLSARWRKPLTKTIEMQIKGNDLIPYL